MSDKGEKLYDLIVIGATGFTGAFVLRELVRIRAFSKVDDRLMLGEAGSGFTLAVAGRNQNKLKGLVSKVLEEEGGFEGNIDVLVADCSDYDQIKAITSKAHVVLSCVGPFQKYGEPIVKACVSTGTHYVDITGEKPFVDASYFNYNDQARENDIMIVHCCGMESIPCDMSQVMIRKRMVENGVIPHSIDAILTYKSDNSGQSINYATYHSAFLAVTTKNVYRKKIKESLPKPEYIGKNPTPSFIPTYDQSLKAYKILMPSIDGPLIRMGNQISLKYNQDNQKYYGQSLPPLPPAQVTVFFTVNSIFTVLKMGLAGVIIWILSHFNPGLWILLNYPQLVTFGKIWPLDNGGPSQDHIDNTSFEIKFKAKGITGTLLTGPSLPTSNLKPDANIEAIFKGTEPGYDFTSKTIALAALTILKEKVKDNKPLPSGVINPSLAFYNTKYFDRLMEIDKSISFEITNEQY